MLGQLKNNNIYNNKYPQKIKQTTSPLPSSSMYANPLSHNIPQQFDNILDPTSTQEMIQEILELSKIKDGFYLGDKISAISLEVINEFKITHIINTTGNQIMNQWESIGINYLTINWSENPNQILFDLKDEIAEKIVEFIDKGISIGEGVLAHSFNGKNRVCLVALIYLMKKYKWSLAKSMQYLKSKKNDVEITNSFYNQLENFQKRLIQKGELTRDIPWEFENLIDEEEKLIRNTYMNSLPSDKNLNLNEKNNNRIMDLLVGNGDHHNNKNKNIYLKHIIWADNSPYNFPQGKIEIFNLNNDLCLKKDIKSIICHQKCKPIKPCIKNCENKLSDIEFNISVKNNNINIIKQKINFDCPERNNYRNEYSNKIEYNNQLNNDNLKKQIVNINDIDKNISNNNTNSNTPALKDQIENKSSDLDNNKFNFNIGSINSLNPNNINNFRIFEDSYNKETPKISNEKNKQNKINIINYTPINMNNNNKEITIITKANKANNSNQNNVRGGYNKKNVNNGSKNILNKPLNNFNPNLMRIKNQISSRDNFPSSHPLFNKNKNKENVPVKIKNYNNSNIKKPTTPVLNHTSNPSNLISKDNFNSTQTSSLRYNSTKKMSSSSNNFNSASSGISFNNNNLKMKYNTHNHQSNNYNKSRSDRPSTAPHKDQNKQNNNIGINFNSNSNLNSKIKKNKSGIKSKVNQRPMSAENKNKYKNNFDKNYINNHKTNSIKPNNYNNNNNIYVARNSNYNGKDYSKGMNQNNLKTNNNYQKYNFAKQRRPSPVIKPENMVNKKANK